MLRCLLLGHLWQWPTPEQKALGIPARCRWCGAIMPDMRQDPSSKHLPTRPEDKMIDRKETK